MKPARLGFVSCCLFCQCFQYQLGPLARVFRGQVISSEVELEFEVSTGSCHEIQNLHILMKFSKFVEHPVSSALFIFGESSDWSHARCPWEVSCWMRRRLYGKFKEIVLHIPLHCEFRWQVSASIVDLEDAFLPQIWGIAGTIVTRVVYVACLSQNVWAENHWCQVESCFPALSQHAEGVASSTN